MAPGFDTGQNATAYGKTGPGRRNARWRSADTAGRGLAVSAAKWSRIGVGRLGADDRGQLLARGAADAGDAAEVLSSVLRRRGPTPGDVVELRAQVARRPGLAVEGDREAVRLVADALQQAQRRALGRAGDGVDRVAGEDQLLLLGQADGDEPLEAERAQRLVGRRELALAAVDDDQIGQRPAALDHRPVAAQHDLRASTRNRRGCGAGRAPGCAERLALGRRRLRRATSASGSVAAIPRRRRIRNLRYSPRLHPAVLADDHRRHRLAALERRDVEALDAARQSPAAAAPRAASRAPRRAPAGVSRPRDS